VSAGSVDLPVMKNLLHFLRERMKTSEHLT